MGEFKNELVEVTPLHPKTLEPYEAMALRPFWKARAFQNTI